MLILLLHLIISFLIGFIRFKSNKIEAWCYFTLSIFFPVGGYFISFFLITKISEVKSYEDDFEDEKMILLTDRMVGHNTDVVAIEDFLTFGDEDDKRRNIIDVLKRDSSGFIDKLKIALSDDDSETAHYAASAITEYKRKLDLKIQNLALEMERQPEDIYIMQAYLEVLKSYVGTNLLDIGSKKHYQNMMLDVLYKLIKVDKNYYKLLIEIYIAIGEHDQASRYSEEFLEAIESEDSYITRLTVLFNNQDKTRFDKVFNDLRTSDVKLNNKSMNILRFWLKDVEYVKY